MMKNISRREWVQTLCGGLGSIGLAGMLAQQQAQAAIPGHYAGPHIPAKGNTSSFFS